jgi:hypothetical protein
MKTREFTDAYWTARFAPYVFAVAIIGLIASFFWFQPLLGFLVVAILFGILLFAFHALRWRTGRELFQVLAIASTLIPLLTILSRQQGFVANLQYIAAFVASYSIVAIIFRGRILRWLNHAD